MTLRITIKNVTLSITIKKQHSSLLDTECRYAECHYAECRGIKVTVSHFHPCLMFAGKAKDLTWTGAQGFTWVDS